MRVLVISAAFPPMQAGEATNAYHFCRRLAEQGLEVHVLTSVGRAASADAGIIVHPIMRGWSWREAARLGVFLRGCAPDVIYLMYLGWIYDFQFMSTFIPTIARRVLPTVPFVTRFENIAGAGPQTSSLGSRLIRKVVASLISRGDVDYQFGTLLRDSDTIVLLSGGHQAMLEQRLPGVGRKCVLMPPPVNMCMSPAGRASRERGRLELGAAPDDFLLVFVGFVYPGKGIETLLRSVRQLTRAGRRVRLAIIGGSLDREFPERPNYLQAMQSLATDLGIDRHVVWTGEYRWDDDQASVYLRGADACVLPFESGVRLNNSSLSSAAAHGLPIITTRGAHHEPQFVHRQNVFLCPPESIDALAAALTEVMDDPSLLASLAQGSLELARDWYGWQGAIDLTLSLFRAPLDHRARTVAQAAN
jgi:glycosyltransferase involved in cell wall biosynthesis